MHPLPLPARTCIRLAAALPLAACAGAALAAPDTRFAQCTEFVGVAPVALAAAQALVPPRYTLVAPGGQAQLVVRVADCAAVQVGRQPARPGRVAQIGLIIASPDGTATDPATSINNYTITYATDSAALAAALRVAGVPAVLDTGLAIETHPGAGGLEFYAAVSPELNLAPAWFLHGTVQTPSVPTSFLANWWRLNGRTETKMATTIPLISFDFSSQVSFTTTRQGAVGSLLAGNRVAGFPLSFRGAFELGTMVTSVSR